MSEHEQKKPGPESQAGAQRDLAGLLGGLLGGQLPQAGADFGGTGQGLPGGAAQDNDVANVLGGLLGGGQAGQAPTGDYGAQPQGSSFPQQNSSGMAGGDLGSLLGGLLGGGAAGGQPSQQDASGMAGGDMGALLGGLLGGGMAGGQGTYGSQGAAGGTGDLGGLLGGLLGGGGGSGGLGGLLGGVIGSDQTSSSVAQQTGLGTSLVQALLPMIVGMLLRGGQRSNMRGQGMDIDGDGIPDVGDQAMGLVERMQRGDQVDPQELRASGLTRALAQQSGYSEAEVAPATVKILEALANQNPR